MSDPNNNPAAQQQQKTQAPKDSSGDTVTIACKLPHGLVLRAFVVRETEEVTPQGSRTIKKAEQIPGEFVVLGNSFPEGGAPRGRMEFGFALTPGCPKQLWDKWHHDNKANPMVTNGLVFANSSDRSAIAEAREKENERSGFERLDPTKLPKGIKKADPVAA